MPEFVRSDNGGEFAGDLIRRALDEMGSEVALIAPGAPWQNGKNERFNGILSQELLSREVWGNRLEAQVLCGTWRARYNMIRPHGSLGMMTPSESTETVATEWSRELNVNLVQLFGPGHHQASPEIRIPPSDR